MAKQQYIVSTLTNSQEFPLYSKPAGPGQPPVAKRSIVIAGKAGLPNKHLLTPRGVVTPVTSDDLEVLEGNKIYQRLKENGWLTVIDSDPRDADKVAADQAEGDGGKQLTPADVKKNQAAAKVKGQE
jgi:hypothetical protein